MAEMLMNYIFFKKEEGISKDIKEIILEKIDNLVISRNNQKIEMKYKDQSYYIEYKIIQRSSDENCYLMLKSDNRVNVSMQLLSQVDDAISKTSDRKYYYIVKNYDGISEEYCKKLYPKYACFERRLREVVFIILTKAYGNNWYEKTKISGVHESVAKNARGEESLISDALEHMDYSMLEKYLFEKRIPNYADIVDNSLAQDRLNKMSKEEICTIINQMRARSLWESHFSSIGNAEDWENDVKQIHSTRNKVAHNKKITKEEYKVANENLNRINKNLQKVVLELQEENFTQVRSVDVLGNFALFVVNNIRENGIYRQVFENFSARIKEMIEPIKDIYTNNIIKTWTKELALLRNLYPTTEMVDSLNAITKAMNDITPSIPQIMSSQQILPLYKNERVLNPNNSRESENEEEDVDKV